jgi:hypothetical protein
MGRMSEEKDFTKNIDDEEDIEFKDEDFRFEKQFEKEKAPFWQFAEKFSPEDIKELIDSISENSYKISQLRFHERRKISWPVFGLIGFIFFVVSILVWDSMI